MKTSIIIQIQQKKRKSTKKYQMIFKPNHLPNH